MGVRCLGKGQSALLLACLLIHVAPLRAFLPTAPLIRLSLHRHARHSCSLTMAGKDDGAALGRRAALRLAGFATTVGGLLGVAQEGMASSDVENRDEVR